MQGCCCAVVVGTCTEFWDFLATKTQLEITLASELVGIGWFDCTTADCQAVIDGTYILTKIPGTFGSSSCLTEGSGRTFSYTFSDTIDCSSGETNYTGVAVYFECASDIVYARCVYRKFISGIGTTCSPAYWHDTGIALPADLSSGEVEPDTSFTSPCIPTSANMPFTFL